MRTELNGAGDAASTRSLESLRRSIESRNGAHVAGDSGNPPAYRFEVDDSAQGRGRSASGAPRSIANNQFTTMLGITDQQTRRSALRTAAVVAPLAAVATAAVVGGTMGAALVSKKPLVLDTVPGLLPPQPLPVTGFTTYVTTVTEPLHATLRNPLPGGGDGFIGQHTSNAQPANTATGAFGQISAEASLLAHIAPRPGLVPPALSTSQSVPRTTQPSASPTSAE